MRKYLLIAAALLGLWLSPARAADSTVTALTSASALGGTELLYVVQGAADRKGTPAQFATYIYGLASGDCTISGVGAVVCTKTNGAAFAPIATSGSASDLSAGTLPAGRFPALTGDITTSAGAVATTLKNTGPGATGPLGSATTAPSVTIDAQGRVTALSSNNIALPVAVNLQTGTNYAIVTGDFSKLVNLSNAANQVPTIAQAGSAGFLTGWYTQVCNQGAGTQTITPATSTIGGAATFVLPAGSAASPKCAAIVSDGTNYQVAPDFLRMGAGVETAAAIALSGAGGLTTTVASGTSALGTSAIGSAACASAVTTAATNTATTDVVQWGFNGDPTAVTGYVPLVAGMLTIIAYPSSGNVNFKVCNNTNASITPGAITLNWRVAR